MKTIALNKHKLSWSMAACLLIGLVSLWHLFSVRVAGDNWKQVIASDGAGYYAYLPATFIYHDLTYKFAEKNSPVYQSYLGCDIHFFGNRTSEGKRINKYFAGTSVLELPFFLLAWILSAIFHYQPGGYSYLFQLFICIAAIFYLLAGLLFIRKLLLKMEFRDKQVMLVLLLLFFGTNLYYYALEEPSMSHVYSFAAISFFLLNTFNLSRDYSRKKLILFAFALSIIILIRPTNGIILLFVPFFFTKESAKQLFAKLISDKAGIIFAFLIVSAILFIQPLSWKFGTEHWIENSYRGEQMNFSDPHFIDVLFSWRKGFFIYTPVLLFSIAGLLFIHPFSRRIIFIAFLILNLYIISSWHIWSYGGSFGMRPFIDTYPVLAISLAFLIREIRTKFLIIPVFALGLFFVFLNLFETYQYHTGILPFEFMTWNKYKRIFLQSDPIFSGIFYPGRDTLTTLPPHCHLLSIYKRNFDHDNFSNQDGVVYEENNFSSPGSIKLDLTTKLSADLFVPLKNAIPSSSKNKKWVEVKAKVCLNEDASDAKMVIAFKDEKNVYGWNGFYLIYGIDKIQDWSDYTISIPLPEIKSPSEVVSVYVLKEDDKLMYLDDVQVSFWEETQKPH